MRLEIDAGNTRIKWRCIDRGKVIERGETASKQGLSAALAELNWGAVDKIAASSVVNDKTKADLISLCEKHDLLNNLVLVEARPEMAGVRFAYQEYQRLGVDRCLAMIAAYQCYPEGVLVIDAGSALTADFVLKEGLHIGGYILPGFHMLKESLLKGTAEVHVNIDVDVNMSPGKSTEECVDHGRYFLCSSLLKGLVEQASVNGIKHTVVTGGDGAIISALLEGESVYRSDLVFDGLAVVAEECARHNPKDDDR